MKKELEKLAEIRNEVSFCLDELRYALEPFYQKYEAMFPKPLNQMSVLEKLKMANSLVNFANSIAKTSPADSDS